MKKLNTELMENIKFSYKENKNDGNIYDGEFDDKFNINGKRIMRYNDELIYKRVGKGYLC